MEQKCFPFPFLVIEPTPDRRKIEYIIGIVVWGCSSFKETKEKICCFAWRLGRDALILTKGIKKVKDHILCKFVAFIPCKLLTCSLKKVHNKRFGFSISYHVLILFFILLIYTICTVVNRDTIINREFDVHNK